MKRFNKYKKSFLFIAIAIVITLLSLGGILLYYGKVINDKNQIAYSEGSERHKKTKTVLPAVLLPKVPSPVAQLSKGVKDSDKVMLTFDDGPDGVYTEQVADILEKNNVHGYFFFIGKNVEAYPEVAKKVAKNHTIGNHTYDHTDLTTLKKNEQKDEISKAQDVIYSTTGVKPVWLRPPGGKYNKTTKSIAKSLKLKTMMWDVNTYDWSNPGTETIASRSINGAGPGAIILLHSTDQETVECLQEIIDGIRARGLVIE